MSPDSYLQYAALFISYFVKVAGAYLLCWLLARLITSPRRRFTLWLGFMLGSLGYWVSALTSILETVPAAAGRLRHALPGIAHQFVVPTRFGHWTAVLGRGLICAYILVVVLLVAAGIWKRIQLHFLLRQGAQPSKRLQHLFAEMCRHFGVRHCQLLILSKVSSPATVCWWRPRIVLPQACDELDDSSLMADILYHELAHVARRDYLWSTVNDLICRLLFFHPGVWQAIKQMNIHREMACDLAVVAARPEHRVDYAHTLTRVARLCLPRKYPVIGIDFAAAPSLLTHRVHAILHDPEKSSWAMKISRTVAGMALVAGYGVLCAAIALGIVFAPPIQPAPRSELRAARKLPAHSPMRHRSARVEASHPEEESLITDSPAYRLTTTEANDSATDMPSSAGDRSNLRSNDSNIPGWGPSGRGSSTRSAGRTVESIIVATVGTVIGADKDDRSKRKDSSHFQSYPDHSENH